MVCRLSTYASFWIRQSITRAIINQKRTIHLPISELGDFIANDESPSPEEINEKALLRETVKITLDSGVLTPKERRILELHFGLRDDNELTLKEIAKQYGLTRQRILQIKNGAFLKLRHSDFARQLLSFL